MAEGLPLLFLTGMCFFLALFYPAGGLVCGFSCVLLRGDRMGQPVQGHGRNQQQKLWGKIGQRDGAILFRLEKTLFLKFLISVVGLVLGVGGLFVLLWFVGFFFLLLLQDDTAIRVP